MKSSKSVHRKHTDRDQSCDPCDAYRRAHATGGRSGLKGASPEIREASRARAPDSPSPGEYTDVRTARPDEERVAGAVVVLLEFVRKN
jgi:hypothetical protein